MIQTPHPSRVTGGHRRGRAAPRPGRLACAALAVLWLTALLVGAGAAAAEAPPPPQEAPPKAPADADPGSQPEAAPKPDPEPKAEPETEAKPEAEPEDEPGAEAREKDEDEDEPEDRPRPKPGEPLLLNFKDASLHAVLEYFSEAAGLIIVVEAEVEGRVTVMSLQPISTDEAIALLDTVLKEEGYAAVRNGRTLKIVSLERAAKENIPTFSGGDPDQIPIADRLVTQIIPVRFAEATKLKTDLAPLLSSTATLSTNAASNALVLVDTQANIRRMAEIIQALDAQISGVAEVKVFQLEYANATNAARLITELFQAEEQRGGDSSRRVFPFFGRGGPDRGGDRDRSRDEDTGREQKVIAAADDRTNTLVVSAPPDLLTVIEGIIEELDSNPSEEESFFVYPLKNADAKNLETVLNQAFSEITPTSGTTRTTTSTQGRGSPFTRSSSSQRVAAGAGDLVGQVYVVADEDTNSLIVRAASKHFDRINELLLELDRPTPQVLIKVLIAEVTHEDEIDLGSEFSILNLQFGINVEGRGDLGGNDEEAGGLVTATMTGGLAASFNALQREGRLDVLSRPYILASDNQEASITVGQEVPRITNSRTTETGQTVNTIQYQDVGIILSVTPHVNPDGLVIMDVSPEISSITETVVAISETVNAQVIAKRSAQTRVAVSDGQTIVIGGLMEDRIDESVRKVPGLGDIPLLGALFRKKAQVKVKTELLIFLTPRVAKRPEDLKKISEAEEKGSEAVQEAIESGAFDKHMRAMRRGAASRPAGEKE